jgi:succinate dehydrogenase / fumarate reductase cytochrome b subunit
MKAASLGTAGKALVPRNATLSDPWTSHVVLKAVMAASGFLMFGFLIVHLSGNLLVFSGASAMNQYAAFLHGKPVLLWAARLGLLATVLVHAASAIVLARSRRRARPIGYRLSRYSGSSLASRTMLLSGAWIAGFVVLHLLHFTSETLHTQYRPGEPFYNLVHSFQSPAVWPAT